jgi:hypothetical protein
VNTRGRSQQGEARKSWSWKHTTFCALAVVSLVGGYLWWNWKPPAVATNNLKYIQLLRTAVSSESPEMLRGVERAVQKQHERKELTETELEHFRKIIQQADKGHWQSANQMAYQFEQAQSNRAR